MSDWELKKNRHWAKKKHLKLALKRNAAVEAIWFGFHAETQIQLDPINTLSNKIASVYTHHTVHARPQLHLSSCSCFSVFLQSSFIHCFSLNEFLATISLFSISFGAYGFRKIRKKPYKLFIFVSLICAESFFVNDLSWLN